MLPAKEEMLIQPPRKKRIKIPGIGAGHIGSAQWNEKMTLVSKMKEFDQKNS